MKATHFNLQITGLFLVSLIPWPGPAVFKISCPRDNARIVRKIIQNKWIPILEKYKVSIPLECPFHTQRDIFGPQQTAKFQHRPSQWTCGLCGKSFFEEKYLDMHFDNRHKGIINMAEDAVCLSDYCDIMRCDVLMTQDPKAVYPETINTDIELWKEGSGYKNAITKVEPNELVKHGNKQIQSPNTLRTKERCQKSEAPENISEGKGEDNKLHNNSFNVCQNDLVESALPAADNRQQRLEEFQKLKANCKPEQLRKLKTKCEILVRDCISGLLIQLSTKDFREMEDELNRAVCWYLTCDRYWEDSQTDIKQFPWGLLCMIIMVLSLGISLCYYVIWVLFDSDDISVTSASMTDRSTPSPGRLFRHEGTSSTDGHQIYTEDHYMAADKDNEYIYVTYPPDLKRRLLESCYNRTTRL